MDYFLVVVNSNELRYLHTGNNNPTRNPGGIANLRERTPRRAKFARFRPQYHDNEHKY